MYTVIRIFSCVKNRSKRFVTTSSPVTESWLSSKTLPAKLYFYVKNILLAKIIRIIFVLKRKCITSVAESLDTSFIQLLENSFTLEYILLKT